jgi:hypothetical protein
VPQILIIGSFRAPKFNEGQPQNVHIYMCILRLLNVKTDVVISINNASATNLPTNEREKADQERLGSEARDALMVMVGSFRVVDWSLFGH